MSKKIATSSLYHDTRRAKKDTDLYPVKVKVSYMRKAKYYPTSIDLSIKDYTALKSTKRLKEDLVLIRKKLDGKKTKAEEAIDSLITFTFEGFEQYYIGNSTKSNKDVISTYHEMMNRVNMSISTRGSYKNSLDSILNFINFKNLGHSNLLPFHIITSEFLHEWEKYMEQPRESKNDKGKSIKIRGKSTATVSIYSRTLRAVFNYAISQGYITRELYPFGTNKYIPPAKRNTKNFLTGEEIKRLLDAEIDELSPQKKARDFFILSYLCNGMNIGDILNLKNKQLKDDGFEFYRIKTKSQRKEAITPINVSFKDSWKKHVWSIIEFYKNDDIRPDAHLFPVYRDDMDEMTRYRTKKNFTRFIDQHLLKLCKKLGIEKKVGSNYARHTFASMLSNSEAPIIEIRDLLGHTEMSTTEGYLHSLGSKKTSEALNNLI